MEKFLLRTLLAGDKLNIVNQKQVSHAVLAAEGLHIAFLNRGDQFVGEILAFYINNAEIRVRTANHIADCIQKVGFAQTGLTINKERVVVFSRMICDRNGSRVGELVGRTNNEVFKGVLLVGGKTDGLTGFFRGRNLIAINDRKSDGFTEQLG